MPEVPTGVGRGDLVEADLNLAVAERVAARLREAGIEVVLTRETDSDLGNVACGALAPAVGARALVSIHHGEPVGSPADEPRPGVVHQIDDLESRRLAGLCTARCERRTRPGAGSGRSSPTRGCTHC
ncbi:MAG: N-acetylmuramoyl-L-alanine amidase [Acidimicrobiales bacterium]